MMEDNKSAMGEPSTTQDNAITPTDSATEATQLPLWARPVEKKEKVSRRSKVLRNVLTRMEGKVVLCPSVYSETRVVNPRQ